MSNKPTVPFSPPSHTTVNLSSQNILSLTVKRLPLCESLLRRYSAHFKIRNSLHRQIIYPTIQITSTPGISWKCKDPACKTSNIKMEWGRKRVEILENLVILEWLDYTYLIIGISQLEATCLWKERYL